MPKQGYKQTEEHRLSHLSKFPSMKGEKNPNWKGGIKVLRRKEYQNEYTKKWRKKNKDKVKLGKRKRYLERLATVSIEEWEEIKKGFGNSCPMCGIREPEIRLTIDHIVPLSLGGAHIKENIQPLCGGCNSRKGVKIIRFSPGASR